MTPTKVENAVELTKVLVKALVAHPEEVHVQPQAQEKEIRFRLQVHPDDVRHVIGRQGRTIQAIRTVVAAAAPPGQRLFFEIGNMDPRGVE
ncbi:MAG: KH domain-containing protein [Bacillota bacterium]